MFLPNEFLKKFCEAGFHLCKWFMYKSSLDCGIETFMPLENKFGAFSRHITNISINNNCMKLELSHWWELKQCKRSIHVVCLFYSLGFVLMSFSATVFIDVWSNYSVGFKWLQFCSWRKWAVFWKDFEDEPMNNTEPLMWEWCLI